MNRDSHDPLEKAAPPAAEDDQFEADERTANERIPDPRTFEKYDQAMGELSDADGAASLGGPSA